MICPALIAAAACALLAACAKPAAPVRALPPGATPEEVVDYARAQAQYRSALAQLDFSWPCFSLGLACRARPKCERSVGNERRNHSVG